MNLSDTMNIKTEINTCFLTYWTILIQILLQVFPTCPDGWTHLVSSCYSKTAVNHINALSACQDMGADLLLPLSEEETRVIKSAAGPNNYWIALKLDSQTGKFYTATNHLPPTFTKWRKGEPNNIPVEDCVLFMARRNEHMVGTTTNVPAKNIILARKSQSEKYTIDIMYFSVHLTFFPGSDIVKYVVKKSCERRSIICWAKCFVRISQMFLHNWPK